jgi:crossover junction endodeoxyribonuclease RusA
MARSLKLMLPWPPSVNTYWRSLAMPVAKAKRREPGREQFAARVMLSKEGREYRNSCGAAVYAQGVRRHWLAGPLKVEITAYPPDRRTRDLDNILKATLDALKYCGVITDDGHIDSLHVVRGAVRAYGELDIEISEIAREGRPVPLFDGAMA